MRQSLQENKQSIHRTRQTGTRPGDDYAERIKRLRGEVGIMNTAFAAEISSIDTLPHQRIAVYDHMRAGTGASTSCTNDLPSSGARFFKLDVRLQE